MSLLRVLLELKYVATLRVLEEGPTAENLGKKECCRSGVCCWRRPAALSKEDVERIAAKLNLTPQEFFKAYLVVDEIQGRLCVALRRKLQDGGRFLPWRETYSIDTPCVFLGEGNACDVHDYKPTSCATFKCWDESTSGDDDIHRPKWTREEVIALGWDGVE